MINQKITAFAEAIKLMQGQNCQIGDVRRVAIKWQVNDDELLMAVGSGNTSSAALILNVDEDELVDEINKVMDEKKDLN